ncbi:5372_t:CDS:1, partial [Acaulospora colombiana]
IITNETSVEIIHNFDGPKLPDSRLLRIKPSTTDLLANTNFTFMKNDEDRTQMTFR